jgi:hypothetical protein
MDNPVGQGLEAYGKFRAYLGVFFAILLCMSSAGSGYFVISRDPIYVNSTTGTAKNVKCSANVCETDVTLTVSGNTYTQRLTYGPGIVENASVTVYYSNETPPKFSASSDNIPKTVGYGLVSIGLCVFITALIVAYFVSTSKAVAQVYGGVGAASNLGTLFGK